MTDAVKAFFEPRSVAVIGASRTPGRAGHQQVLNLKAGFKGEVYPVNPGTDSIEGMPCYPSVADIPASVELAIVLTPAPRIPEVVESCVQAEVPAVLIPASGFAKASVEGLARQQRLLDSVRGTHTRLWGPNCAGLLNISNHLLASFVEYPEVRKGGISIVSQTGTYALGLFRNMMEIPGYGLSKIATIGNACDITEADVLEYLADDPDTKIIALHLEGVPGGARTFELCRAIAPVKPVLALVAGQTQAGKQASLSHTAGLATDARVVRGLLDQAGVIPVRDFTELIDLTRALSVVGTPHRAKRVAVVSTSGAACVLSADLITEAGLEVATLSPSSEARLAALLPDPNSVRNPIDVSLASLTHGNDKVIPEVASGLFEDPQVDAALFAMGAFAGKGSWFSPNMLDPAKTHSAKPAVAWSYGPREYLEAWSREFETLRVPTFRDLRAAIAGLAAVDRAAAARHPASVIRTASNATRTKRARRLIQHARQQRQPALTEPQTRELLADWGIEGPTSTVAANKDEALEAARRIGFPVAVKGIFFAAHPQTRRRPGGARHPGSNRGWRGAAPHARGRGLSRAGDDPPGLGAHRRLHPHREAGHGAHAGSRWLVSGCACRGRLPCPAAGRGRGGSYDRSKRSKPSFGGPSERLHPQTGLLCGKVLLQLSQLAEANLDLEAIEINPLVVVDEDKDALALARIRHRF